MKKIIHVFIKIIETKYFKEVNKSLQAKLISKGIDILSIRNEAYYNKYLESWSRIDYKSKASFRDNAVKKIWNAEWKKTKELWRSFEKGCELSKEIRLDVSDNSWLEEDKDRDHQLNTQYYSDSLRLYDSDEGITILKTEKIVI